MHDRPPEPPRGIAPSASRSRSRSRGEEDSVGLSPRSAGCTSPFAHAKRATKQGNGGPPGGTRRHGRFFTNSFTMHRQRLRNGHIYIRPFGDEPGGWRAPLVLGEEIRGRLEALRKRLEADGATRRAQHVAQEFRTAAYTVVTPTLVMSPGPPPAQVDLTRRAQLVPRQLPTRRSRSRSRAAQEGTPDRTEPLPRRIVTLVPRKTRTPRPVYHRPDPEDTLEDDLETLLAEDETALLRNGPLAPRPERPGGMQETPSPEGDHPVVLLTYARRRGGPAACARDQEPREPTTGVGREWEEITRTVRVRGGNQLAVSTTPPRHTWECGMAPTSPLDYP